MTYALIDNSTLTAVQRISGQIQTKSNDSVDTDIVALENFVQAILFYDRTIAIDDYIPRYREQRVTAFPNTTFLNTAEFNLGEIEEQAAVKAREIQPKIQGGQFVNKDFKNLIDLLQTHMTCTWDISSSIYHLTLKSLSDDQSEFKKYGNIAAAIFSELSDATETGNYASGNVELVDRYGNQIKKGYTVPGAKWGNRSGESAGEASGAIKAFVASLVWLANRTIFYSQASRYLQADTFLYPIRQAYQQNYISQTCNYGFDYPKHIVEHFSTSFNKDLVSIHNAGLVSATAYNIPMFSAWLAKKTGDPSEIVNAAYQLRDEKEFVEARDQLREVRRLFDESDIGDANRSVTRIIQDLNKASSDMRVKFGIETRQGIPVTNLVQVYNTYAALNGLPKLPSYKFKIKLPEFFYNFGQPRGFNAIYRNLTHDLATVWSLGEARDILGSKVVKDERARVYNPKQEQRRYMHVHTEFKSPM